MDAAFLASVRVMDEAGGLGAMLRGGREPPVRASVAARWTAVNVSGVLREAISVLRIKVCVGLVARNRSLKDWQITFVIWCELPFQ